MKTLRTIICDDEPLAVDRLGRMLEALPGVEVVQTFLSGEDMLARFTGGADLLLLDIEMPKLDGFDVVEALSRLHWSDADEAPVLVFVTAHSERAVQAFDSGAIDFLRKPVRLSRLDRAVERAREAVENRQARRRLNEVAEQLHALRRLRANVADEPHLWLRKGSKLMRLNVSKIDWISAEGECVRIHSGEESYLERLSISAVAQRLSELGFMRIHRSAVVNTDRIESMTRTRWGALKVRLRTGTDLRVSKSFEPLVRGLKEGSRQAHSRFSAKRPLSTHSRH
ncbi:LytTR family DNA-binding domain-containing protein [Sphingomonas sp.]|uniref:LytR/AlgR family response regulator transcription factor n=1 Tax=Sphingomonas sp. TaxID=28214 RepID=UPI0017F3A4E4|nr:LytTR family DNA-binding domain-containing protein [Sphingomonas sp.]MBA3511492.1 response regulator transcription factor [Sphingomonas sp.]